MTRLGSLFTGTAALDMAAAAVLGDIEHVWYSDIKPAAVALLAHRFPGVPNLGDMTAVDWSTTPQVDVLTFGWPCQPHSSAGKRLGEADPRALWPHVARTVAAVRPRLLLGENVARVASSGELRRVVRSLAEIGYVGAWRCVRASDVGAPHRRDRCFLAAIDPAAYAERVGFPGRGSGGSGEADARREGSRAAAAGRGADSGVVTLLPTPTQSMTTGAGTSGRDGGLNLQTAVALLPTPKASDGTHGGPNMSTSSGAVTLPAVAVAHAGRWGTYADAITRWGHVLGRPAPEPTQPSARTGKPQLAPPFVEWMMGLPAGWVTDVPDLAPRPSGHRNAALSLLGDGVVPQQAAHAYRFLLGHLAERLTAERAA